MMTKITGLTNGYFCVRQNDKKDVLIASLINAVIPADAWNDLRDKVCNDTATRYVMTLKSPMIQRCTLTISSSMARLTGSVM